MCLPIVGAPPPGRRSGSGQNCTMTEPTLAPAAALRRIAFLLERGREPPYKVRAFRRGGAAVDATDPGELARLAAGPGAGLRGLPGIGEVTERVIREGLAGEGPGCLRRLEAIEGQPVPEGAAALRAAPPAATAPPTAPGPTGAARSPRWPRRPATWATSTWS